MVTDTQQTMTAALTAAGVMTRVAEQLRQFICGLHGHDSLLHFERGRMSLLCTSCGHETPGWDLRSNRRPQPTTATESPRIVRMPLVRERRVA
jgi:hypothetical protein